MVPERRTIIKQIKGISSMSEFFRKAISNYFENVSTASQ